MIDVVAHMVFLALTPGRLLYYKDPRSRAGTRISSSRVPYCERGDSRSHGGFESDELGVVLNAVNCASPDYYYTHYPYSYGEEESQDSRS